MHPSRWTILRLLRERQKTDLHLRASEMNQLVFVRANFTEVIQSMWSGLCCVHEVEVIFGSFILRSQSFKHHKEISETKVALRVSQDLPDFDQTLRRQEVIAKLTQNRLSTSATRRHRQRHLSTSLFYDLKGQESEAPARISCIHSRKRERRFDTILSPTITSMSSFRYFFRSPDCEDEAMNDSRQLLDDPTIFS